MVTYDGTEDLVPIIPSWPAEQVHLVITFNHKICIYFSGNSNSRTNALHRQLLFRISKATQP